MTASPSEAFFASARSKIKWAEQHMQKFHGAMLEFLGSGSYQASIKDEPQTQSRFYEIVQRKRLPDSIPCLVGDAVHNLRSALDHVAHEIVKRSGRVPSEGLYFPIKDTRPEVIGAIKTEIQVAAGTDLIALIADRIQPHRGGHRNGHTLWVLHRLDCIDKHRELLTAVEDIGFEHIEAVDEEGTTYTGLSLRSVGRRELQWPHYVRGKKLYLKNEGKLFFEIRLDEVEVPNTEAVLPLLTRLRKAVVETIDEIEAAYRTTGT